MPMAIGRVDDDSVRRRQVSFLVCQVSSTAINVMEHPRVVHLRIELDVLGLQSLRSPLLDNPISWHIGTIRPSRD